MIPKNSDNYDTILYDVHPGDSLSAIIQQYYGTVSPQIRKSVINKILVENPEIKNPHFIYPGQVLVIDIPQQYNAAPGTSKPAVIYADEQTKETLKINIEKASSQEKSLTSHLAPIMIGTGSAGLTMINHTFKTNAPLISEVADAYNDYKAGKITKGQYDYQRVKSINKLKLKLGPTKLLMNIKKPLNEIVRISRKKGSVPTQILEKQVMSMKTLSKIASRGSVVLSVAGLGIACNEIASTNDQHKKNEIIVESLGALGGGVLYGMATTAAIVLMATPVGWIGALVIGVGSVLAGYASGVIAKDVYNIYGNRFDLASEAGVSQLCKK